jgi:hypothetical protein
MPELRIIGILITDRVKEAGRTQEVLSQHAQIIKSRLGFHEVTDSVCSRVGFITIQVTGKPEECNRLEEDLMQIGGLEMQKMVFQY